MHSWRLRFRFRSQDGQFICSLPHQQRHINFNIRRWQKTTKQIYEKWEEEMKHPVVWCSQSRNAEMQKKQININKWNKIDVRKKCILGSYCLQRNRSQWKSNIQVHPPYHSSFDKCENSKSAALRSQKLQSFLFLHQIENKAQGSLLLQY